VTKANKDQIAFKIASNLLGGFVVLKDDFFYSFWVKSSFLINAADAKYFFESRALVNKLFKTDNIRFEVFVDDVFFEY
jgi:hypothetical protein